MYIDTQYNRVFVKSRQPSQLAHWIAGAELVNWKGHNVAVPFTLDAMRVLRNVGVKAPSPIRYEYNWPGPYKPYDHQITTSEFATLHRRCFILNEMGTSKTASALWAADYLMLKNVIRKVLVIAPLSTLEIVWRDEVFRFLMHRTAVVLHGEREKRERLAQSNADFLIVNYDGLKSLRSILTKRGDIDLIIVDEVGFYRNSSTDQYARLKATIKPKQWLWLMTGTPCPSAPTDAWALAKLTDITPAPKYLSTFKQQTMMQVSTHKWIPRDGWKEKVYELLQPGIRFAKKDCLDLPPVTVESRQVELTDEQWKMYRRMKEYYAANINGETITAVNAGDRVNKLRQILCGSVKNPETGEYVTLPHSPRLRVLMECIEQADAKVIVIVPFKGIIRTLAEEVSKTYTCEIINGDVSITKRNKIFSEFKVAQDPRVLLCHPEVMAHGLNLTVADTLIFYAPIYSNELDQQVTERINRPGQQLPMTIVRMGGHPMEWQIYQHVENQRLSQETMLDLYNEHVLQS